MSKKCEPHFKFSEQFESITVPLQQPSIALAHGDMFFGDTASSPFLILMMYVRSSVGNARFGLFGDVFCGVAKTADRTVVNRIIYMYGILDYFNKN